MSAEKFFVCTKRVYFGERKLRLLKRGMESFKDCGNAVGGHLKEEIHRQALKKDFMEEINLGIDVGEIIDGRIERPFDIIKIIIVFEITSAFGEIDLSNENEARNWNENIPFNLLLQLYQLHKNTKKVSAKNPTKNNKHSFY